MPFELNIDASVVQQFFDCWKYNPFSSWDAVPSCCIPIISSSHQARWTKEGNNHFSPQKPFINHESHCFHHQAITKLCRMSKTKNHLAQSTRRKTWIKIPNHGDNKITSFVRQQEKIIKLNFQRWAKIKPNCQKEVVLRRDCRKNVVFI